MADLTPQEWQDRIKEGLRYQERFAQSQDWSRYKDYYRHKGFASGIIPVNLIFSILRSMTPQVYFRNPRVTITARRPGLEAELHARIVQKLDNWLLRELETKREFKRLVADNFFCGIGAGFFGYDSLYGFSDKLAQGGQMTFSQFDKQGNRTEFQSNVNPGMPWFLRARPEDVVFPFGATDRQALEWVAFRVFRSVRDMKVDKKYQNTSELKGTHVPVRSMPEGGRVVDINETREGLRSEEYVELWQIHDARTGRVMATVMDNDKFLRNEEDPLQLDGLPVETVCFNPDSDFIYGVPDARIIEPQLLELNDIRTQAMKHRRVNVIKGLILEGSMTDDEISKLLSEDVQAIIKVRSDTGDVRKAYSSMAPGVSGILTDLIAQGEVVRGDVRETVGFSRTAQGEFQGKTHVSAEETKRVFQSLNIRLDERRDEMADLLERVVRKWNQIIFERWTSERLAQVVGPDGAKWWLKFTGPQIKDEYDLNVVAEEGPPMDRETKMQMALQAAEVWAKLNAGQIQTGAPIPMEIQRLIFNNFEDTGLDIDRLMAQSQAALGQGMQNQLGGAGSSEQNAISPGTLASLFSKGGR